MIRVDYTQLDQPIRLTLEQEGGNYIVLDANDGDTVYRRSPDLEVCKRFMVAMQAKREAVIDMDSYHWFWALGQHSVKVAALAGREVVAPSWDVADGTSRPANVVPIRKPAA